MQRVVRGLVPILVASLTTGCVADLDWPKVDSMSANSKDAGPLDVASTQLDATKTPAEAGGDPASPDMEATDKQDGGEEHEPLVTEDDEDAGAPDDGNLEPEDAGTPELCEPVCLPSQSDASSPACDVVECVLQCEPGWADCDDDPDNGCETDLARHCGPCKTLPGMRKPLVIDGSNVPEDQTNFPVFVALEDPDLASASQGGLDICFAASDGETPLPFELEQWDHQTQTLRAWVQVPVVAAGEATEFYLYYGSAAADVDRSNPAAVWDDYVAVLHMDQPDAAGGALTGSNDGASVVSGKCGSAMSFDGDGDYLEYAQDELDNLFAGPATVEAWIRPSSTGQNGFGRIVDKALTTDHVNGWALFLYNDERYAVDTFAFAADFGGLFAKVFTAPDGVIELSTWQHVAAVFDGSQDGPPTMYVNGQATNVSTVFDFGGELADDADNVLRVGNHATELSRTFDGLIDEVRISKGPRSANWFATQYSNQSDPVTFMAVGTEEAVPE